MKGKLIVVEGTDCSGKETQTNLLLENLRKDNIKVEKFSFPNYQSPTGRIIAGPYLGKSYVCDGWFPEGAPQVEPKVAALYYAADRKYNIYKIKFLLDNGVNVILDRYVYSNMAHQGGKIKDETERFAMYNWLNKLEFELLELPEADIKVFLHLPVEHATKLRMERAEALDENEKDVNHLKDAERAYKEIATKYNFQTIECNIDNDIRTIEDIQNQLYEYIKKELVK